VRKLIVDVGVFGFLPKRAQDVVSVSLRKAIMAWIDDNPTEFLKLYSKDEPISYHAEKMFDIVMSIPDLNNRRDSLWPLAMSLVLLCPETIVLAVRAILLDVRNKKEYSYVRISKKVVYLDNVRQCTRIDALCEISAICMTDFAKAVYLFPKDNAFELIRYANANEKEMSSLILDSSSRLYKNNRDRNRLSQLVLDKLIAVYRSDIKEFFDICLNKSYLSTSNTYITFNMARFCREFAKRMSVNPDKNEFTELYPIVAPRIRRQLQHLLQTFVPNSPTSPDRAPTKGAAPVDKVDLIIEILKDYMVNLNCALVGTKLDDKLKNSDDHKVYMETEILDYIIEETVASKNTDIAETGADLVELLYSSENAWRWTNCAKANPDDGQMFWQYTYTCERTKLTVDIL
jgi:hypothetical protein